LLLAITQPWLISNWLFSPLQLVWNGATFASQSAQIVAAELIIAGCALLFIGLSREPWSRFGIDRLRPLWDLFGTGILYFATGLTISMSNGLFLDLAREWLRPDDFDWLFRGSGRWVEPHGGLDLFIALGVSLCIGFSEELVYRGFLIPRFEQLIHSTWASVLLTSVLFAAMHWNQGLLNSWNALGFGLIFGIAFARFRHLWPLVFAHALVDFVVILRSGTDLT
jgi:membrane protease YdiL (CAAX protease family)